MSFNLKTVVVQTEYAIKSYADFRLIGSGGTIRLKRIDGGTESFSQLVLAADGKSLLSDPKDIVVLDSICFIASRPNLIGDAKSKQVMTENITSEDHKALLNAVLEFRRTGVFPTVIGNTGLAFVPVAAEKTATGSGMSAAQILAEARNGRSNGTGGTAFRRSRNIS